MNYIGSKKRLLNFIDSSIKDFVGKDDFSKLTFCDIFTGTTSVARYYKAQGMNIIANDLQYYSYVMAMHYIFMKSEPDFKKLKLKDVFEYLNSLEPLKGFIFYNYTLSGGKKIGHSRSFFSDENASKIDAIRLKIEEWNNKKLINKEAYFYLLSCLLESADKVANVASVYESYLKNIKSTALKKIIIKPLVIEIFFREDYQVFNLDANVLIKDIKGDILYLDPPYNSRNYDSNYHMLETISKYDNPKLKAKAGLRDEKTNNSNYTKKKLAQESLEDLIKNANFNYIFLSYNNEGIIHIDKIREIMSKYGNYKRYETNYRRFKSDSKRNNISATTIEYLHCLSKTNTF